MKKRKKFGLQNHNYVFVYAILLAVLSLFFYNLKGKKQWINYKDVKYIRFWYIDKCVITDCALTDCNDVLNMDCCKDTVITDKMIIYRYISIINQLQSIEPSCGYDLRVTSIITLIDYLNKGEKQIPVCLDLKGRVLINDILMQDNDSSMIRFLDEVLYSQHTQYDWLPNDIKRYIEEHPKEIYKFLPKE